MNCKSTAVCESELLDRAAMIDRVGGDEDLLREIAGIFLEECPGLVSDIRSAVDAGDAGRLERAAHTLKGAVANFGAHGATQAAFQLEHLGRQKRLAEAPEALDRLETQLEAIEPALRGLAAV